MRGKQMHTIDAKGRLFIPSKFRDELGIDVVVAKSLTAKCIWVYSKENWEKFEEKIKDLPGIGAYDVIAFIYSNSEDMKVDPQGRIAIPDEYIEFSGLSKNIVSRGVRDHMEIWDEDTYREEENKVDITGLRKYLIEHGL